MDGVTPAPLRDKPSFLISAVSLWISQCVGKRRRTVHDIGFITALRASSMVKGTVTSGSKVRPPRMAEGESWVEPL